MWLVKIKGIDVICVKQAQSHNDSGQKFNKNTEKYRNNLFSYSLDSLLKFDMLFSLSFFSFKN